MSTTPAPQHPAGRSRRRRTVLGLAAGTAVAVLATGGVAFQLTDLDLPATATPVATIGTLGSYVPAEWQQAWIADFEGAPAYAVTERYDADVDRFVATFHTATIGVHRIAGHPGDQRVTLIARLSEVGTDRKVVGEHQVQHVLDDATDTFLFEPTAELERLVKSAETRLTVDYELAWHASDGSPIGSSGLWTSNTAPQTAGRCDTVTLACAYDFDLSATRLSDPRPAPDPVYNAAGANTPAYTVSDRYDSVGDTYQARVRSTPIGVTRLRDRAGTQTVTVDGQLWRVDADGTERLVEAFRDRADLSATTPTAQLLGGHVFTAVVPRQSTLHLTQLVTWTADGRTVQGPLDIHPGSVGFASPRCATETLQCDHDGTDAVRLLDLRRATPAITAVGPVGAPGPVWAYDGPGPDDGPVMRAQLDYSDLAGAGDLYADVSTDGLVIGASSASREDQRVTVGVRLQRRSPGSTDWTTPAWTTASGTITADGFVHLGALTDHFAHGDIPWGSALRVQFTVSWTEVGTGRELGSLQVLPRGGAITCEGSARLACTVNAGGYVTL